MTNRNLFKEITRFLYENVKISLLVSIIGVISYLAFSFFVNSTNELSDNTGYRNQDSNMATFAFYVENSQQQPYINSNFLDSLLLKEEYLKKAEESTNIEISKFVEEQLKSDFVPTLLDRGYLGVGRDVHNETMIFQARFGTEEENLAMANFYYDLLINNQVPFLENKEVYFLHEPYIADDTIVYNSGEGINNNEDSMSIILLKGIMILIGGYIIGVMLSYFYHLFTDKINYSFVYEKDETDQFFNIRSLEKLETMLFKQNIENRLILCEHMDEISLQNKFPNIHFTEDALNSNLTKEYNDILILVIENHTDKNWYYTQREILKGSPIPIKIIQVPSDIM